jgi:protein phosphatase 1 regulatory subunit 37
MPTEHDVVVGPSLLRDDAALTAVQVQEDDRAGQAVTLSKVEQQEEQQERVKHQRAEEEQSGFSLSGSTDSNIASSSVNPQASDVSIPAHPESAAVTNNARAKLSSSIEASASPVGEGSNPTIKASVSESAAEIAVPVGDPYRRNTSRTLKPKGILKPPPPPQTKFSFRRDVLSYVVSESTPLHSLNPISAALHLAGSGTVSTGRDVASPEAVSSVGRTNALVAHDTTLSTPTARDVLAQSHNARLSSTSRPLGGAGGGLWKRLGGAVSAVTASVAASQSIPRATTGPASPRLLADTSPMIIQTQNDEIPPSAQASTDNLLNTESIKSVRFTMSSLAIVYPINGPQPPGKEADTRKRINLEYRAKHELQNKEGGWTNGDLLTIYEECCRTREHPGIPTLRRLFMVSII